MISGRTGSGKTDILKELKHQGAQVLDLEGLAVHRGSLLGKIENRIQPGQRLFESNLYSDILKFNCRKPIYVESESSRIGNVQIPRGIWQPKSGAWPHILARGFCLGTRSQPWFVEEGC